MTKPEAPTTPAVGSQLVRGVSPLPEPNSIHIHTGFRSYSADQIHAYATPSVTAHRERARVLLLAALAEGEKVTGRTLEFGPVTSVIRGAAGTDFQVGSLGIFKYDDIKQIL